MASYIVITTGPNHNNDPQGKWNVTGKQSFRVIVTAYNSNGTVDTSYNKTITIYADNGAGSYPYQLGSGTPSNGQANITCNPLSQIYGTNPFRRVIARSSDGLESSPIDIAVYFYIYGTVEFYENCDGTPSYKKQTACVPNGLPANSKFVALPATGLCNKSVYISRFSSGTFLSAPVRDVGPFRTSDPYWNTGNYPTSYNADIDISDGLATDLGISYGCNGTTPYGGSNVLWRFTS